jgi:hypothetical protein
MKHIAPIFARICFKSHLGLLEKIVLEVRFSRKRFGIYDTIDFICVLIGYTLSGEATLLTS